MYIPKYKALIVLLHTDSNPHFQTKVGIFNRYGSNSPVSLGIGRSLSMTCILECYIISIYRVFLSIKLCER